MLQLAVLCSDPRPITIPFHNLTGKIMKLIARLFRQIEIKPIVYNNCNNTILIGIINQHLHPGRGRGATFTYQKDDLYVNRGKHGGHPQLIYYTRGGTFIIGNTEQCRRRYWSTWRWWGHGIIKGDSQIEDEYFNI